MTFLHKSIRKFITYLDKKPVILLVTLSLFFNCYIEILSRRSLTSLLDYIWMKPFVFLVNAAIIMFTFSIAFFVKRRAFAVFAAASLWTLCGAANFMLITFRATPFIAYDLILLADGIRVAGVYLSKVMIVLIITALAALVAGVVLAFIKMPKCTLKTKWIHILGIIIPCVILFVPIVNAQEVNMDISAECDNIIEAYNDLGFVYCFTSSLLSSGIAMPDNYSEETVASILSELDAPKLKPEKSTNVVFVQLESFFDPSVLEGLNVSKNPIPVFTKLKKKYPSGSLRVPTFGGGTANTEFEVLTGIPLSHFAVGEYPYETAVQNQGCESIASNLKNIGYTASAIHNHSAAFYSRNTVYANLGFDRFVSLEYMRDIEYTQAGWAKDSILTDNILGCLEASDGQDFVFAVSVQPHGAYPEDFEDTSFDIGDHDFLNAGALEYYLMQLNETDAFIGELIAKLEEFPENTVLVLYGDHLPALPIMPEQLKTGSLYMTDYVIWSNFGLEAKDKPLKASELSAYVLGLIGVNEGNITKLHQLQMSGGKVAEDSAFIVLEYDMLYGERYMSGGEPFAPSELQMGISDVRISNVYAKGRYTYVSGSGFTSFSAIHVDGKRKDTEYLSESLLRMQYALNGGDTVSVSQCGLDRAVLSSSGEWVYW